MQRISTGSLSFSGRRIKNEMCLHGQSRHRVIPRQTGTASCNHAMKVDSILSCPVVAAGTSPGAVCHPATPSARASGALHPVGDIRHRLLGLGYDSLWLPHARSWFLSLRSADVLRCSVAPMLVSLGFCVSTARENPSIQLKQKLRYSRRLCRVMRA